MPPLSHAQDSRDQSSQQVLYSKVIHIYNNHKVTREIVLQGGRKSTHAIHGIQLRKQMVKIYRCRSREKTHKEAGAGVLTN